VELVGDETVSFGVSDPRLKRVHSRDGNDPHTTVAQPATAWQLVVPLHDGARDLNVRQIHIYIYDESGKEDSSTAVDRPRWLVPSP